MIFGGCLEKNRQRDRRRRFRCTGETPLENPAAPGRPGGGERETVGIEESCRQFDWQIPTGLDHSCPSGNLGKTPSEPCTAGFKGWMRELGHIIFAATRDSWWAQADETRKTPCTEPPWRPGRRREVTPDGAGEEAQRPSHGNSKSGNPVERPAPANGCGLEEKDERPSFRGK